MEQLVLKRPVDDGRANCSERATRSPVRKDLSYTATLIAIAAIHILGNFSPGPNLVLVSQVSAAQSRHAGFVASIGLALGAVIWATAASAGLGALSSLAWLQDLLRYLGGAYLIYIGVRKLLGAGQANPSVHAATNWQAFRAGVLLNLANPYCLIFFGGIFAAMLPPDSPYWFRAAAVAVIFADALLWYGILAFVFSTAAISSFYSRIGKWLDRIAGGLLHDVRIAADLIQSLNRKALISCKKKGCTLRCSPSSSVSDRTGFD
jgi:threonine/homoserine/homoserine lactone efflux protein